MKILDVVPLRAIPRGQAQMLTYFTLEEKVEPGSLVRVKIRKSEVNAVVWQARDAAAARQYIRKGAAFELQPITRVISAKPVLSDLMRAFCERLATHFGEPLTHVVAAAVPVKFRHRARPIEPSEQNQRSFVLFTRGMSDGSGYKVSWQPLRLGETELLGDRVTLQNALMLSPDKRRAIFSPPTVFERIVLVDESNDGHKSWDQHPKIHNAIAAQIMARLWGVELVLTGFIPSVRVFHAAREGRIKLEIGYEENLAVLRDAVKLLDMRTTFRERAAPYFARDAVSEIRQVLERNGRVLVYHNRKGFATYISCLECGYVARCPKCGVSLRLYDTAEARLKCHYCGHNTAPPVVCSDCRGARLDRGGTGLDKIAAQIQQVFIDIKLRIITADAKIGPIEAPITVATSAALTNDTAYDLCLVPNVDLLLNEPVFDVEERAMQTLMRLRARAPRLVLQTYNVKQRALELIQTRARVTSWYDEVLDERRIFRLPPFYEMIDFKAQHRSAQRPRARLEDLLRFLEERMRTEISQQRLILSDVLDEPRSRHAMTACKIVARVKKGATEARRKLLESIPGDIEIDVEPL